jgi:peptidoglycan/LPS O-acetylase OafA/YrhL
MTEIGARADLELMPSSLRESLRLSTRPSWRSGASEHSVRRYRPDIDGIRALAILAVVAFHSGLPFATGGYVGVDVFFVVSGYLIVGLLIQEAEETVAREVLGGCAAQRR